MLKRLKFAHARGARIQVPSGACKWQGDPSRGEFVTVGHPYWSPTQAFFRIHPDDAALEYGPLSSAFIAIALDPKSTMNSYFSWGENTSRHHLWEGIHAHIDFSRWGLDFTEGDWRMYCLFLAEYLADEGL